MKLKGCLITDMENIEQEYYLLWSETIRKRDTATKENDYKKYRDKANAYARCHEKMKQVLKFINNL